MWIMWRIVLRGFFGNANAVFDKELSFLLVTFRA